MIATSAPAPKAPLISEGQYEQILARFVARWEEAEDEALEGDTLGVEGVDPTESIMEWAEKLKAEVRLRICSAAQRILIVQFSLTT